MSRIRSDIPIYAYTPHVRTARRVTMYRGVFPIPFEIETTELRRLYQDVFNSLLGRALVEVGDLVIITKGDLDGVSGSTNAMKVITVTREN